MTGASGSARPPSTSLPIEGEEIDGLPQGRHLWGHASMALLY